MIKYIKENKEMLLASFAVFAWGTMAPISKVLLNGYTNMEVLGYGSAIGALTLFIVLWRKHELNELRKYGFKKILKLILLGFFGYFLYSASYYEGLKLLSSQTACVLNYLWPIVSVVMSAVFLHERITGDMLFAILLSFAGVIFMMFPELQSGALMKGYLYCLLGALLYGTFNVLNKKQGGNQTINMFIYLTVGALCALIGNIPSGFHIPNTSGILGLLWLGIIIDGLGYLFWAMAMQGNSTGLISNFAYATPVISLLLSAILLGENISGNMFIGMILIFIGIGIQVLSNLMRLKEKF